MDTATTITIAWKNTTLHRVVIDSSCNVLSVIARFPSIGLKQLDPFGKLLQRFQISFGDQNEYEKCCQCLSKDLELNVTFQSKIPAPFEMSQMSQISQSSQPTQNEPENYNLFKYPSQSTQPTQTESEPNLYKAASQSTSSYDRNSIPNSQTMSFETSQVLEDLKRQIAGLSSIVMHQQNRESWTSQKQNPFDMSQQRAITQFAHAAQVALYDAKAENLSDLELKKLVIKHLKDPKFVDLVIRLDKIIQK